MDTNDFVTANNATVNNATAKENSTMENTMTVTERMEIAKNEMPAKISAFVRKWGWDASDYGCRVIVDEWWRNNKPLIDKFSTHPNWDPDNFRIVFDSDYTRGFETAAISEFYRWVMDKFDAEIYFPAKEMFDGKLYSDFECEYNRLVEKVEQVQRMYRLCKVPRNEKFAGKTLFEWELEMHNIKNAYLELKRKTFGSWGDVDIFDTEKIYYERMGELYPVEMERLRRKIVTLLNIFTDPDKVNDSKLSDSVATKIKSLFPIRIGGGATVMKALRRVFDLPEFKELREWSSVEANEWVDSNTGEMHSREKTISLETKLSELADRISPLVIKRHTIISLNPIDWLGMSMGYKWASCHDISKGRFMKEMYGQYGGYNGEWCTGTFSYMLDGSSVLFYTIDKDYDGNEYETQGKMQRVVFALSEDGNTLLQSRVYPDGRDGGDASLAAQFRAIMQKVVSDVYDLPNYWNVKKGNAICEEWTSTIGTHYVDYTHYDDGNISFRVNYPASVIKVGHYPIDPDTGKEHDSESDINGSEGERETCDHCGGRFSREDEEAVYCEDNDRWYCCEDCAESEGVHYCANDSYGCHYHTESYCFYDDYRGEWYYGDPEVTTEDGHHYASIDNAYSDGYDSDPDGYWYPLDEMFCDAYTEVYHHIDDMEVDIDSDHQYVSTYNAEQDGCICINRTWYVDEDDAKDDGCVYVEGNDTWYASYAEAEANGNHYVEEEDVWMTEDEYAQYGESQVAEELEAEETTDNANVESEVA